MRLLHAVHVKHCGWYRRPLYSMHDLHAGGDVWSSSRAISPWVLRLVGRLVRPGGVHRVGTVNARRGDVRTAQSAASRNSRSRTRTPLVPREGHPPAAPVDALPGARLQTTAALSAPLEVPAPYPPPPAAAAPLPPPPTRTINAVPPVGFVHSRGKGTRREEEKWRGDASATLRAPLAPCVACLDARGLESQAPTCPCELS
jgi:hypothetical protein